MKYVALFLVGILTCGNSFSQSVPQYFLYDKSAPDPAVSLEKFNSYQSCLDRYGIKVIGFLKEYRGNRYMPAFHRQQGDPDSSVPTYYRTKRQEKHYEDIKKKNNAAITRIRRNKSNCFKELTSYKGVYKGNDQDGVLYGSMIYYSANEALDKISAERRKAEKAASIAKKEEEADPCDWAKPGGDNSATLSSKKIPLGGDEVMYLKAKKVDGKTKYYLVMELHLMEHEEFHKDSFVFFASNEKSLDLNPANIKYSILRYSRTGVGAKITVYQFDIEFTDEVKTFVDQNGLKYIIFKYNWIDAARGTRSPGSDDYDLDKYISKRRKPVSEWTLAEIQAGQPNKPPTRWEKFKEYYDCLENMKN